MLEMLDYTIRIGSTPTFLYFDLNLYSAYAAHYVYLDSIDFLKKLLLSYAPLFPMLHRILLLKGLLSLATRQIYRWIFGPECNWGCDITSSQCEVHIQTM